MLSPNRLVLLVLATARLGPDAGYFRMNVYPWTVKYAPKTPVQLLGVKLLSKAESLHTLFPNARTSDDPALSFGVQACQKTFKSL